MGKRGGIERQNDKCRRNRAMSDAKLLDVVQLSQRERRFLFSYLLSGNASATYLATILGVGGQLEHCHQAGSRMFLRIKRKVNWPRLLENVDIGALNLIRSLEAELAGSLEGDGAAALLADLLNRRAAELTGPGTLAERGNGGGVI